MPKGAYNGQKLIKLVSINTPARINKMVATPPEIWFVKYNIAITIATRMRITLSAEPIFAFMFLFFLIVRNIYRHHKSHTLQNVFLPHLLHKDNFITAKYYDSLFF